MALIEACVLLSMGGVVILSFLGVLLIYDYEYIPFTGVQNYQRGMTCISAAGIYLIIMFILMFKLRKNKTSAEPLPDNNSDSSDEDAPFIKINRKKKA